MAQTNLGIKTSPLKSKLFQTSDRFRKLFLLKFTQELIKRSKVEEFFELEHVIRKKEPKRLDDFQKLEKEYGELIPSLMHREPLPIQKQRRPRPLLIPSGRGRAPPIIRPQTTYRAPPQQVTQTPVPAPRGQLELGKLNPLIQDPAIQTIECNGTNEHIIIRGNTGSRTTNIILTKEEIDQVLNAFSQSTRIPIEEGVVKIALGRLLLSAIVSDVVGSKFIIKKMAVQMAPQY